MGRVQIDKVNVNFLTTQVC